MPGRLTGKVALITGAARGQGSSHAVRLAREGADIIAIDICAQIDTVPYPMATEEDLAETVAQVEALDRRIVAVRADVRDLDAMRAAVDTGVSTLGRLDIVCANAGISSPSLFDMPAQQWHDMIDTNLTGPWNTSVATVPHLRAGGRGGSIIFTNSVMGLSAHPGTAHYTAAKHGLIGLMKTLALELAPEMIRVNAICPGQVDTPMIMNDATFRQFDPAAEHPGVETFAPISQGMNAMPVPWVESEDVSNAVVFLASEEGRYITGVALPIDLGTLLK